MRLRTKNLLLCLLSITFLAMLTGAFRFFAYADGSASDVGGGTNPNQAAANVYSDGDNAGELKGVYFSLPKGTSIPYSTDWEVAYAPENAAALKLVRGSATYEMGTENGTIIKYGSTDCYLKIEAWMLKDYSSYLPFRDGDVIVVDGVFANSDNGSRFNISRTLFEVTGDKTDGFSVNVITESENTVHLGAGFDIEKDPEENEDGIDGIYFGLNENDSVISGTVYTPSDKSVVTFKRKGVNRTYNSVTLVKTGVTEYLLNCSDFGIALPLRSGDLLTINGIEGYDVMKNKSSYRSMPLIPYIRETLLEEKRKQEDMQRMLKQSYCQKYLEYVCVDAIGNIIEPQYLTCHFSLIIKKNGLKKIRFHDLRHSCASILLANKVPMKMIQDWLGHSDMSTTANIYSHIDYTSKIESAETMGRILSQ